MAASLSRHGHGAAAVEDEWEKQVTVDLARICLESGQGESSIDALRDALITVFPQVLPAMKQKFGKFTAFLKAHSDIFQISSYDRSVRLIQIPAELRVTPRSRHERSSHASMDSSQGASHAQSNPIQGSDGASGYSYSTSSDHRTIQSSAGSTRQPRTSHHGTGTLSMSQEPLSSPRQAGGGYQNSGASFSRRVSSQGQGQSGGLSSSGIQTNAPPKHVAFSSLEPWEQMCVFASLKHLLHVPGGVEHYTVIEDRLNEPQLLVKYKSLCDLLCLFPGNFVVDAKGFVSLSDPVKARAQYPTLAAEFERRLAQGTSSMSGSAGTPSGSSAGGTNLSENEKISPIVVAVNNATTSWEKALLRTVWNILMSQANHAANFPWVTTQLVKFKPHVKQIYGSLRLWAIQQSVFKFQGDTIYVPANVAPMAGTGMAPTMGVSVGAAAAAARSANSYASVNSANFSIPLPPALPAIWSTRPAAGPPPPPPPPASRPTSFSKFPSVRLNSMDDTEGARRGRSELAGQAHRRQRSASPTSIRAIFNTTSPNPPSNPSANATSAAKPVPGHHRSLSSRTTDDIGLASMSVSPPSNKTISPLNNAPTNSAGIPRLTNLPPHPFQRRTSASTELKVAGAESARNTHAAPAQPLSPRHSVNPLIALDKDIPSLPQVPLAVNRTNVTIKPVLNLTELKRMIHFLSTFSVISISAELVELTGSQSARGEKTREGSSPRSVQEHEEEDDISEPLVDPALIIGSAPSNFVASPLDHVPDHRLLTTQDDMLVARRKTKSGPILHDADRPPTAPQHPNTISVMCLTARTLYGHSPYAPSSTMAGHSVEKELFRAHPVFVLDLQENPQFYKFLRPLLQSDSTLKVVYNCPALADVLYTHRRIHLNNIVDIQVLHRLLWEISSLPQRFSHVTGLDLGEESKNAEHGGHNTNHNPTKSVDSNASSSSTPYVRSPKSSSSGPRHGMRDASQVNKECIVPPLDVPLGVLLKYFDIQLSGLALHSADPLFEALTEQGSDNLRAANLWPQFSVSAPSLLHLVATCVVLLDLRILMATQMATAIARTTFQLSQGYSHVHLHEYHHSEGGLSSSALMPLSHDSWIDAPELFGHLSEGQDG